MHAVAFRPHAVGTQKVQRSLEDGVEAVAYVRHICGAEGNGRRGLGVATRRSSTGTVVEYSTTRL